MSQDTRTCPNTSGGSTLRARNFAPAMNMIRHTLSSPKLVSTSSKLAPFLKMLDLASAGKRPESTAQGGTLPTSFEMNSSRNSSTSSLFLEHSLESTPSPSQKRTPNVEKDSPNPYSYLAEYHWDQPSPPKSQAAPESPPPIDIHNLDLEKIRNLPRDRVIPNRTRVVNKGKHRILVKEFIEIKSKKAVPIKEATPIEVEESDPSLLWDQPPITRRPDTPFPQLPSTNQKTPHPSDGNFHLEHADFHVPSITLHVLSINLIIEDKDTLLKKLMNKPLPPPPSPFPPSQGGLLPTQPTELDESYLLTTEERASLRLALPFISLAISVLALLVAIMKA